MGEDILYYLYLVILLAVCVIGTAKYRSFDKKTKIVVAIMLGAMVAELAGIILTALKITKNPVYHFYNVLELFLITFYLFRTIKLKRNALLLILAASYILLEILNCIYLQSLFSLNSNYISFESFLVIGMSLFALYKILVDDSAPKIKKNVHFFFWTIFLFYFSATFFYWSFIKILYKNHSVFYEVAEYSQIIANIISFSGIGVIFLFYPKTTTNES